MRGRDPIDEEKLRTMVVFVDNDQGYLLWLAGHPNGYVINSHRHPRPSYLVLHRATCHTINGVAHPHGALTSYPKTCFLTRQAALAWVPQEWAGSLWECGHCDP